MRNFWIVVLVSAMLTTAGLLSPPSRLATAQEAVDQSRVALIFDGALNRDLPANPLLQHVSHDRCGIGLGGWCPRLVRACLRAGRPDAACEAYGDRCEACNQAMVACRQKVGHRPGYTCDKCRAALTKCRDNLSPPLK